MIPCKKCRGFVIQRLNYSHEGKFTESYCINCGLRIVLEKFEDQIRCRKMSRNFVIPVKLSEPIIVNI